MTGALLIALALQSEIPLGRSIAGELDSTSATIVAIHGDEPHEQAAALFRFAAREAGTYRLSLRAMTFEGVLARRLGSDWVVQGRSVDDAWILDVDLEAGEPEAFAVCGPADGGPFLLRMERRLVDTDPVPFVVSQLERWSIHDLPLFGEDVFIRDPDEVQRLLDLFEAWEGAAELLEPRYRVRLETVRASRMALQGEYAKGREILRRVLADPDTAELPDQQKVEVRLLAVQLGLGAGAAAEARRLIDEAVDLCSGDVSDEWRVHTLGILGTLMVEMGDERVGLQVLERALADAQRLKEGRTMELATRHRIAYVYRMSGAAEQALGELDAIAAECPAVLGEDHFLNVDIAVQRAGLLVQLGRVEEAESLIDDLDETLVEQYGDRHPLTVTVRQDRARLDARAGRFDVAIERTRDTLASYEDWFGPSHGRTISARTELSRLLELAGDRDAAWRELAAAVRATEESLDLVTDALSERERHALVASHRSGLDRLVELAARSGSPDRERSAYEAVLRWKGRVSRNVRALRERLFVQSDPGLEDLVLRLRQLRQQLSRASLLASARWRESLADLRAERDRLERDIGSRLAARAHEAPTLDSVRSRLPRGAVLVDFLERERGGDRLLTAWIVRGEPASLERIELGPSTALDGLLAEYLELVVRHGDPHDGDVDQRATLDPGTSAPLRQALWRPLSELVAQATTIYVSPDGSLWNLPFEVLMLEDGSYVVEHHDVVYVLDASRIAPATPRSSSFDVLAMGGVRYGKMPWDDSAEWPELRRSRGEARAVLDRHERCFGDEGRRLLLSGSEASETRLQHEMPNYAVVHLATHGFCGLNPPFLAVLADTRGVSFDPFADLKLDASELPDTMSAVVCADPALTGSDDNGLLTAEEVGWLDLSNVELVVLSACSSGRGAPAPGEGLFGLRRAFLQAGARTVISTLWPVGDFAAADLMRRFYDRYILGGESSHEALRGAQLDYLREATNRRRYPAGAPAAWGAFVLQGAP